MDQHFLNPLIEVLYIRRMDNQVRILGIAGSLRKGSYNRAALRAAQGLVPIDAVLTTFELDDIPLYNQDLDANMPKSVLDMKEKIRLADAILFVTPEYNYSVPGVLKNAIDWASRPRGGSSWDGKPAAIMGASPGMFGSARAQYHLRQTLVTLNMFTLNRPEVLISNAADKFDNDGNLTDVKTQEKIRELLEALVKWTMKLR